MSVRPGPLAAATLYDARVVHQRTRPVAHRLRSRIPMLLIDPDAVGPEERRLRTFSRRRPALFGFSERDHGDGRPGGLSDWVGRTLDAHGIAQPPASVRVLCMPRVLGRVFNPLTLILACDTEGDAFAVLYQVDNTFGERHVYVLPVERGPVERGTVRGPEADPVPRTIRQSCPKRMHVSPFLPMSVSYRFRVEVERARLSVLVTVHDATGVILAAHLSGRRRPLTDRSLLGLFARHGLLELKVLARIHLEAALLWGKGIRFHPHPGRGAGAAA